MLSVKQPEFSWSGPEDLTKMPCHMALVKEPDGQRNVGQMQIGAGQQFLSSLDSPSRQITVRRHTCRPPEFPREMKNGEAGNGSHLRQVHAFAQVSFHMFRDPPHGAG